VRTASGPRRGQRLRPARLRHRALPRRARLADLSRHLPRRRSARRPVEQPRESQGGLNLL
jgi:hypothetical protein